MTHQSHAIVRDVDNFIKYGRIKLCQITPDGSHIILYDRSISKRGGGSPLVLVPVEEFIQGFIKAIRAHQPMTGREIEIRDRWLKDGAK
jgi:hypothetical protein